MTGLAHLNNCWWIMDNFRIDVTAQGDEALDKVFALAFGSRHAEGYLVTGKGLIFLWSLSENRNGAVHLPFKMDARRAADFARGWLEDAANYGTQPDHDGSNGKGWRVYNEEWGHVDGLWGAIVAVEPIWAMYGK